MNALDAAPGAAPFPGHALGPIRSRTFDEIAIGDSASIDRTLTLEHTRLFEVASGDLNPRHRCSHAFRRPYRARLWVRR